LILWTAFDGPDRSHVSLQLLDQHARLDVPTVDRPVFGPHQDRLVVRREARRRPPTLVGLEDPLDGPLVPVQNDREALIGLGEHPVPAHVEPQRAEREGTPGGVPDPVGRERVLQGRAGHVEFREGPAGIVPGVVQVDVVPLTPRHGSRDGEDHAGGIEDDAGLSLRFRRQFQLREAPGLLDVPQPDGPIRRRGQEEVLRGAQADVVDGTGMAPKLPAPGWGKKVGRKQKGTCDTERE
jgi:hypothetical protein